MTEQIIGIDFGTSNSVMAWFNPETGKPQVIFNAEGEDKTPSIVYFAPEGVIVGRGAQAALTDAEYFDESERCQVLQSIFCSIKRDLGRRMLHSLPDGRQVSPVQITSEIFKKLKKDAEELFFHAPLKSAVVTYPAAFSPTQKNAIEEAARLAGFEQVSLLEEPIAAALGQLSQGIDIGQGLIVYDLGGGTFDLAYVQRKNDGGFHSPLPSLGLPRCGGDDIDQQIYDLLDEAARAGGMSLYHADGSLSRFALQECRKGKESLSSLTRSGITIMIPEAHPDSRRYFVKREELDSLMKPMVENTVKQTLEMVRRVQQAKLPLGQVVLIGGSTRSPIIPEQLQKALPQGITLSKTMFADNAVALGAAVQARMSPSGEQKKTVQPENISGTKVKPAEEKTKNTPPSQNSQNVWIVNQRGSGCIKTIMEAVNAAKPYDKIVVSAGTYSERVVIKKPIQLIGDTSHGKVILKKDDPNSCVLFSAASGRLENLCIKNGVEIYSGMIAIENCDISNPNNFCILINKGAHPIIQNNRIFNGKRNGIHLRGNSKGTIKKNEIFNNGDHGILVTEGSEPVIRENLIHDSENGGIYFYDGSKGVIEDNDIYDNRDAGILISGKSDPVIRKNRIHGSKYIGILIQEESKGLIEENNIYQNGKLGIAIKDSSNPVIRKNSIHNENSFGIFVYKNGLGEISENEVFCNNQGGILTKEGGKPYFSKNIIRDNKEYGASAVELGGGTYVNNTFYGNEKGAWDIYPLCRLLVSRSGNIEK